MKMHISVDAKRARYCTITKRTENIVIMSSGEHTTRTFNKCKKMLNGGKRHIHNAIINIIDAVDIVYVGDVF